MLPDWMMKTGLPMWTIYFNPADYPGKFVVRMMVALPDKKVEKDPELTGQPVGTLEEARALLPRFLVCVGRQPEDDSVIVETWM